MIVHSHRIIGEVTEVTMFRRFTGMAQSAFAR